MQTTTQNGSRTAHLLALMKKGDDAFNPRDFAGKKAVHHPKMVAHVAGSAEPINGQRALNSRCYISIFSQLSS
jgi:hypothetical protein